MSRISIDHPLQKVLVSDHYRIQQPYIQITEEGYSIESSDGNESYQAKRPRKIFRNFIAGILGFVALVFSIVLSAILNSLIIKNSTDPEWIKIVAFIGVVGGFVLGIVAFVLVIRLAAPKRRLDLYAKNENTKAILTITPMASIFFFNHMYGVQDENGNHLAVFRKNVFESFFRKKWHAFDMQNQYLFSAIEDSLVLALLRNYLGLGRLIPLHFNLQKKGGKPFGHFKRRFSLRDKYNLQYTSELIDGWLLVASALLLDTGERR